MVVQGRVQLPMPDVDGENHAGAVGEQHLGEPAGRGANVETDVILDVYRGLLQRTRKLDAASGDKRVRRLGPRPGIESDRLGRLDDRSIIRRHETGVDRGARPRAAFKQASLDQQEIDAFFGRRHLAPDKCSSRRTARPCADPRRISVILAMDFRVRLFQVRPECQDRPQASLTVSVLTSLPSVSNTLATMPLASSPARAYIAFGESWSRNTSGSTIARILRPPSTIPCSASVCITCEPKPPIEPSSMVSSTS